MYLSNLQQDQLFVTSELKPLSSLCELPTRKGLENAIISNGKIVNVVSSRYGHIPNEVFFKKALSMIDEANLKYHLQTINRDDRSFIMDIIIEDENQFHIKESTDKILPMLRFTNSYDGSEKTSGHFGFYREVCSNGLHIANANIHFSIRHTTNGAKLCMPKLQDLFLKFLDNEYYSIKTKFENLRNFRILDNKKFVQEITEKTGIFKFECSDKNPEPSKKARLVLEILENETNALSENSNLWLGYNAFNNVLHRHLKKSFSQQKKLDRKIFDTIAEMAH